MKRGSVTKRKRCRTLSRRECTKPRQPEAKLLGSGEAVSVKTLPDKTNGLGWPFSQRSPSPGSFESEAQQARERGRTAAKEGYFYTARDKSGFPNCASACAPPILPPPPSPAAQTSLLHLHKVTLSNFIGIWVKFLSGQVISLMSCVQLVCLLLCFNLDQ